MTKLSTTNLFHAVPSLQRPHSAFSDARAPLAHAGAAEAPGGLPYCPDQTTGDTNQESADGLAICPAHLAEALGQAFDLSRDWVVSEVPEVLPRQAEVVGRSLRFDAQHHAGNGRGSASSSADSFAAALGLAHARELLGREHWVVVLADSRRAAASLTRQRLRKLARVPKLLLVWCDFGGAAASQPSTADRHAVERQFMQSRLTRVGPVGGLDPGGVRTLLEALKAHEQPVLLHLRMKNQPGQVETADDPVDSLKPAVEAVRDQPARPSQSEPSAGAAADERQAIVGKRFSPWLAGWIDEYSRVGKRGLYLWQWCLHGVELTTLPCVPPEWRADAGDTKVLAGMLNVLFDDVADQQGNGDLLDELLKITHQGRPDFRRFSLQDRAYAQFTCRVWEAFWRRVSRYPCYEVYRELLHYDLAQLFNTVRYSQLVNRNPYILNLVEHDDYTAQGMGLLSFATVDLMCTPDFPVHELGTLRQAIWHGQWMARIGNLISTWQREVKDRDYTSGVFARAVAACHVTVEQLLTGDPAEIETAIARGGHEAHFLRRWRRHHAHLRALQPHLSAVDLHQVARGLERLLRTELVSRGRK